MIISWFKKANDGRLETMSEIRFAKAKRLTKLHPLKCSRSTSVSFFKDEKQRISSRVFNEHGLVQ